jgi:uncharacterized protein GlcG (DUF336 family)
MKYNKNLIQMVVFLSIILLVGSLVAAFVPTQSIVQQRAAEQPAAKPAAQASEPTDITLEQALAVIEAAHQKAEEQGTLMDIAVVDAGANLKAFIRMDDAYLGSIDISIKKAKTARFFNMPTGNLGELSQPGEPLYNIEFSNGGLITFPGGLPLENSDGVIIGAIGVSGSSVEDDLEVASAGAAALEK